uniref:OBG-type G domain-containing protein n=1 Tax=Setaria italica TaxID=4555 RepID=K4AJ68_SETIT
MTDHGKKMLKLLVLTHGQPGEEVSLELILRVVADVGLVGLPNAGKSTLLSAITLARPDIADYPFTTLMPNLGRLGGDPALGALQFSSEATLADLPGLIEGAHLGKGIGRNFLRHLRRTRVIVHVVDAGADDPVNDYKIVREELRMYNPQYLERPYVVVLNKIDLPKAHDRLSSLALEISSIGCEERQDIIEGGEKQLGDYPRPQAVVAASVLRHIGIDEMLKEIRAALRKCFDHKLPEQ